MDIETKVKRLMSAICLEIKANNEFRTRIERALECDSSAKENYKQHKGGRRTPAVFDPVSLMEQGEDGLRQKLDGLTVEQLKDILAEYGMDPGKKYMRLKTKQTIVDRITEVSTSRVEKGDAFR